MKAERENDERELLANETALFLDFVSELPLDFDETPGEFDYHDPISIMADATLSINRPYKKFVVPRIELIQKSGIDTLEKLSDLIAERGINNMSDFWNYKHPARVEILKALTHKFVDFKRDHKIDDDMVALHRWSEMAKAEDWKNFGVKGIGFTTYQYLRILCGANTVKPDIHIKRAVEAGVGKKVPLDSVVKIVESASLKIGVPARRLDYALWSFYSLKQ